tara:strand:+ start:430 stop:1860 length:1431 start_codon:yes stop_codon:yes gene_type:complete
MDALTFITIIVAACGAGYFALKAKSRLGASQLSDAELLEARNKISALQAAATDEARRTAESDARLQEIRQQFQHAAAERDRLREVEKDLVAKVEVQRKEIELQNVKLKDWGEVQQKFMDSANAALAESATKLSSKLLEDHKREATAAKEDSEKRVKNATEELFKQFETVSNSVASLTDRVGRNDNMVETVQKALSSPGGVGQFAEIGLENSLKSFGLQSGRDFVIQQTLEADEGHSVRPDAVVFLPSDSVLVIDCKASKFLFDLASAKEEEEKETASENLRRTMRMHLRTLCSRDYESAIQADYRRTGKANQIRRTLNIMYLPNEGAIEKISEIDPGFAADAAKKRITVVGPTGLLAIIAFARIDIDLGQQAENQEKIVDATRILLERTAIMLEHAGRVGRGLKTASSNYGKWLASINGSLLPATRSLEKLGVRTGAKRLPNQLPSFQVIDNEADALIEGEAEEVPEQLSLTDHSD